MFERLVSALEAIASELKRLNTPAPTPLFVEQQMIQAPELRTATQAVSAPSREPDPPAYTREQCGQALVDLAIKKNRDAAAAVLAKFGAKLVKEVKEADVPKFFAAIQEAGK